MSFVRLATVELQLAMQHLDLMSLVALARCSRFIFATASDPTAWRFVPAMTVSLPFASQDHRTHWADARLPQHRRSLLRLTSQAVMLGQGNGSSSSSSSIAEELLLRDLALLPCVVAMTISNRQADSGAGTGTGSSSLVMELFAGIGSGNHADHDGGDGGFVMMNRLTHLDVGSITVVPDAPAFVKCIAVHAPHLRKLSFCCPRDARMALLADALSCMPELQVVQLFFFPLPIAACAFASPTPTLSSSSVSATAGANDEESDDAAPSRLQRLCLNNPCQLELLAYPLARTLRCLHLNLALSLGAIDHLHGFNWARILSCATQLRCLEFDRCANPLLESMLGAIIVSESNSSRRLLPRLRHLSILFHLAGSGYFDHTWNPLGSAGFPARAANPARCFVSSVPAPGPCGALSIHVHPGRSDGHRARKRGAESSTEVERALHDFVAAAADYSHNNKQITLSIS